MRFRLRYLQHDLELNEGTFAVGRNVSCQLSLDDPLVSRRHAVFGWLRCKRVGIWLCRLPVEQVVDGAGGHRCGGENRLAVVLQRCDPRSAILRMIDARRVGHFQVRTEER